MVSICFQDWGWGGGGKSDIGVKIEHTFMTNFVSLFTNILSKNTAYLGGGGDNVFTPTILLFNIGRAPAPSIDAPVLNT